MGVMSSLTKSAGVFPVTTILSSRVTKGLFCPLFVCNLCFVEIRLQVEGDKHGQPFADGLVCLAAHAQVHAEARPRMPFAVCVQQISEGEPRIAVGHVVGIVQGAVDGTLYQVSRASGAIVVEEVVAVHPVFRAIILFQQCRQAFFLFLRQVECLLPDVASQIVVFGGENVHSRSLLVDNPFLPRQNEG